MSTLDAILSATREEVARRRRNTPLAELLESVQAPRSFAAAIGRPGLSLIAEHKRRSPSAGPIREGVSVQEVLGAYERGGAAAVSVLTDGPHFGGSLEDLRLARGTCSLPILRKDFILEDYQLYEAAAAGADAVLLIVAVLSDGELAELRGLAAELGLAALVEAHDLPELGRALTAGATLIGLNNRDLRTMRVDTSRTFELLEEIPEGVTVVAESGFARREQLEMLDAAGIDAVLIGEALMRAPDIETACRALTEGLARNR